MEKNLGRYQLLRPIGKGGMGEVFLARDGQVGRQVALKKMLQKWEGNSSMQGRFLREASIAAKLSHPNIIPIYSIDEALGFYTMPFIEGETLKEILKITRGQQEACEPLHPIGASIPSLIRIFLSVCSAVAYCHDRKILHRDLKPENIMVGKYGEVIILDWGLANYIDQPEATGEVELSTSANGEITQPGKIPGTLLYMPPERAFGAKSSTQTDIYSLGVTLYQLLTLQFPFKRSSLKEFKRLHEHEVIHDPEEIAPDREIPPQLSRISMKTLAKDPKDRYETVEDLIKDLERFIEGTPEWFQVGRLSVEEKECWVFQELIPLAPHRALSRDFAQLEWASTMISRAHYPGNLKLEGNYFFEDESQSADILFCIPEGDVQGAIDRAYRISLSPTKARLFRAGVEVAHSEIPKLQKKRHTSFVIEKIEGHIRLLLDGISRLSFLSHIPLSGSQIGLLFKKGSKAIDELRIFVGSKGISVNCLAVPDAFLEREQFGEALEEYRKIAFSFPGRAEGREATFRAGLTLLKQGQKEKRKKVKETLFALSFEEFEKLHATPGAPLELLGKSLIYRATGDVEEEVKYLELALRKYPAHPLKPVLIENILSRLFETGQTFREGAFRFSLLTLQLLPKLGETHEISLLMEKHLEPLPFFAPSKHLSTHIAIQLAFWLSRPMLLIEMLEKGLDPTDAENAQVALLLMGQEWGTTILKEPSLPLRYAHFFSLLKEGKDPRISIGSSGKNREATDLMAWCALREGELDLARSLLPSSFTQVRQNPKSPFFFLICCYLAATKGEKAAREFASLLPPSLYPPIPSLLGYFLVGKIDVEKGWIETALPWEKFSLFQQLDLFQKCLSLR